MTAINVIKRDGSKEPLDFEKIHKQLEYACDGISNVSVSDVELRAKVHFTDNIQSKDVQSALIKTAADMISEETPNYQFVAARLLKHDLYKEIFNSVTPPRLYDHVKSCVADGAYEPELLNWYTEEEFDKLDSYLDHGRDDTIAYAGMDVFRSKYLVRNRKSGKIYETPQFAMILIAATFFHDYKEDRLATVKALYDNVSTFKVNLPTPIMCGFRTPEKQFSSCTLIETDDTLPSIYATTSAVGLYIANKAGIGIGAGGLRGIDSEIKGGKNLHTGDTAFYRLFESAVNSANQGSVRKGSGTLHYVGWHIEFEELIMLKSTKGTPENQVRGLDYSVQLNKLFYERLITNGNISFFSPSEVPGLYEAFFRDYDEFKELYEKYENKKSIRRRTMTAKEFFTILMTERKETGRIYIQNVDHCNTHGAFIPELAPVRMSNLCQEVTLPTKTFENIRDEDGEIGLCTLAAVNWGRIKSPEDFEIPCRLLVRGLDELLSYQDYPVIAGQNGALWRRPLGIGIVGFAHWMAKNNLSYDNITPEGLALIDEWAEAWSYYLIKASVDLAKEKGTPPKYNETKYSQGLLPIDTYKKEVDELVPFKTRQDWAQLRIDLETYGIRNSTLMALMPGETSVLVSSATNGIEPPRALVTTKTNKDSNVKVVVPEIKRLGSRYNLLWTQRSPLGYLKIMAVLQKYIDMAISVNTSYNPEFYENNEIPMSEMLKHLLFHYKYGGKTLYYFNTNDQSSEVTDDAECESCSI